MVEHFSSIFCDPMAPHLQIPFCYLPPLDAGQLYLSLKALPLRKAVPSHCAPTCALKFLAPYLATWLHEHLSLRWASCTPIVPEEWRAAWLVLLPKKGANSRSASHWRPIGLQDGLGKATLKTLTIAARSYVLSELICYPQYAYLPGRGTHDAIARVIQHCNMVQQLTSPGYKHDSYTQRGNSPSRMCRRTSNPG